MSRTNSTVHTTLECSHEMPGSGSIVSQLYSPEDPGPSSARFHIGCSLPKGLLSVPIHQPSHLLFLFYATLLLSFLH